VPRNDPTLFPSGFDEDKHPVYVTAGYVDDIRMSVLQIDGALLLASVYVPYVRRPNSQSGTVLSAPLNQYMAGPNGMPLAALVPSTVSTVVEGFQVRLGRIVPDNAAYQLNSAGVYSTKVSCSKVPARC
jgi:hypothetical protein